MLERLERENLFVVALDDERRWYRYHHLFAEFLRGHLGRESTECMDELHRNASVWNEQNGGISSAIEHALSAGDHERAARLMERGIGQTWYRGEVATLLGWLGSCPKRRCAAGHCSDLVCSGDDAGRAVRRRRISPRRG